MGQIFLNQRYTLPMPIEIEYWGIRGLGNNLRQLAFFLELEFTESRVGMEGAEEYFKRKHAGPENGNSLINLPNIKDGDVLVSEHSACLAYLLEKAGRKDMMTNTWQRDQAMSIINDVFKNITVPAYASADKEALVTALNGKYEGYAKFQCPGLAKMMGRKREYNDQQTRKWAIVDGQVGDGHLHGRASIRHWSPGSTTDE